MASPSFDDQAFDSTNAFDTAAFDFVADVGPTPTVGSGVERRRIGAYVKRGGVGTLRARPT